MRKVLWIFLSLVLSLAGWSTVGAEDGFYVIPTTKPNYAPVPKTGQTAYYGTNDDGTLEMGVAWPTPRFTDNGNGTVTDKLTGLVWLKDASCMGAKTWDEALAAANGLAHGQYGLTDESKPLDWRLPNVRELESLIDYGKQNPALPEAHPFTGVLSSWYWSSTTYRNITFQKFTVDFLAGGLISYSSGNSAFVWCVRDAK